MYICAVYIGMYKVGLLKAVKDHVRSNPGFQKLQFGRFSFFLNKARWKQEN